jgi:hypothetical protein
MASELKVDKFTGVTTAGSIDVVGEGNSTTTNLQQGLAKAWSLTNTDASSIDSFNYTSNTDNATGDYSHGLTNNMNSASYAVPATCGQDSSVFGINKARATNSVRVMNIVYSNGAIDVQQVHAVHGDLA